MSTEIWNQLIHGEPLNDAGAPKIGGRLDLRNLHVAEPHAVKTARTPLAEVTVLGPPNEMKRVDFRRAKLRWSDFRGLDLDEVFFPEDENYPETLDRLLAYFLGRSDLGSRRLAARFEHEKKWLGPRQRVEVLNKLDLIESGGQDGIEVVMKIIGPARRPPKP